MESRNSAAAAESPKSPVDPGNSEERVMMVVCSFSALVRTALFLVAVALVAGLSLAGPSAHTGTPSQGPAVATSEPVEH